MARRATLGEALARAPAHPGRPGGVSSAGAADPANAFRRLARLRPTILHARVPIGPGCGQVAASSVGLHQRFVAARTGTSIAPSIDSNANTPAPCRRPWHFRPAPARRHRRLRPETGPPPRGPPVPPGATRSSRCRRPAPSSEIERLQFKALALANPNFFGTFKGSPFPVVKAIAQNTSYEDLTCVGFQPQLGQIGAVVRIARNAGYSGPSLLGRLARVRAVLPVLRRWRLVGGPGHGAVRRLRHAGAEASRLRGHPARQPAAQVLLHREPDQGARHPELERRADAQYARLHARVGRVLEADIQVEPKKLFLVKELCEAAKSSCRRSSSLSSTSTRSCRWRRRPS